MDENAQAAEAEAQGVEPMAVAFFLCPAAANTGIIDYTTKEGRKLYEDASAKLCDEPFSCDPDEYHDLIQVVTSRAAQWSWDSGIMQIPVSDNPGSARVSLLQEHGKISIGQIRRYEKTYIATHCRKAQDTYMLYQALFKSLSKVGRSKIILEKKDYVVHVDRQEFCSGTLLMKVILNKMHLETKAAARGIRQRLQNLESYISKVGYDIVKFNDYVKSQMQQLAAKGENINDLEDYVLKAYEAVPGEDWKAWHGRVTERIDDGATLKIEDLLDKAEAKYKTLVDNEKWNVLSENEKQIIALQAALKSMRRGSTQKGEKKNPKAVPAARKKRDDKYFKLRDTIPKDPKKPVLIEGKKFWWCGKATGGNCEKLTRHHPRDCVADFKDLSSEKQKSILKKSEGRKSTKKLTIKESLMHVDDDASFMEGGRSVEEEGSDPKLDQEMRDLGLENTSSEESDGNIESDNE